MARVWHVSVVSNKKDSRRRTHPDISSRLQPIPNTRVKPRIQALEVPTTSTTVLQSDPGAIRAEEEVLDLGHVSQMGFGVIGYLVRATPCSADEVVAIRAKRDAGWTAVLFFGGEILFSRGVLGSEGLAAF